MTSILQTTQVLVTQIPPKVKRQPVLQTPSKVNQLPPYNIMNTLKDISVPVPVPQLIKILKKQRNIQIISNDYS